MIEIDLANNKIVTIVDEVWSMKSLRRLNLRYNYLPMQHIFDDFNDVETLKRYILGTLEDDKKQITRSIEFPEEYFQAGVSILNYFGTVLRKKHPDQKANIRIDQDGLKVKMTIDPYEGDTEIIEQALDDFGLVATGGMSVEEYTDDKKLALDLKNKLRMAIMEVEHQRDLLDIKNDAISDLKEMLKTVLHKPAQPITIAPVFDINASPSVVADIDANITSNIQIEINQQFPAIQGKLNELLEKLPSDSDDVKEIKDIQTSLKDIEGKAAEEVKESAAMAKFSTFLEGLESAEGRAAKTINGVMKGVETAQKLAGHYNKIAQWCGLPIVPEPFTK